MGSYGSGRKTIYESREHYHTINVESARVFGMWIVYSEQKNVPGKRPWIVCPRCQRRCGLLYFRLKDLPLCRKCLGLHYPSQRESFEEKQRTYERYVLEQYGAFEEWVRMPTKYLSYAEAENYYHRWLSKINCELVDDASLSLQMDRALSMS